MAALNEDVTNDDKDADQDGVIDHAGEDLDNEDDPVWGECQ